MYPYQYIYCEMVQTSKTKAPLQMVSDPQIQNHTCTRSIDNFTPDCTYFTLLITHCTFSGPIVITLSLLTFTYTGL